MQRTLGTASPLPISKSIREVSFDSTDRTHPSEKLGDESSQIIKLLEWLPSSTRILSLGDTSSELQEEESCDNSKSYTITDSSTLHTNTVDENDRANGDVSYLTFEGDEVIQSKGNGIQWFQEDQLQLILPSSTDQLIQWITHDLSSESEHSAAKSPETSYEYHELFLDTSLRSNASDIDPRFTIVHRYQSSENNEFQTNKEDQEQATLITEFSTVTKAEDLFLESTVACTTQAFVNTNIVINDEDDITTDQNSGFDKSTMETFKTCVDTCASNGQKMDDTTPNKNADHLLISSTCTLNPKTEEVKEDEEAKDLEILVNYEEDEPGKIYSRASSMGVEASSVIFADEIQSTIPSSYKYHQEYMEENKENYDPNELFGTRAQGDHSDGPIISTSKILRSEASVSQNSNTQRLVLTAKPVSNLLSKEAIAHIKQRRKARVHRL